MRLILFCVLLIAWGHFCCANETLECSSAEVRPGKVKGRARSLEFTTPVTNGRRVSRCRSSGTPSCSPEESQTVADVYCQGVGFEFAFSWVAASVNETFCFPEVAGLDGSVCNNARGKCQAFEKIVCAGPKIVRGFIEAGSGFGVVEFKQDGKNAPVQVIFKVDGMPKGDLDFAIHEQKVNGSCARVGKEVRCTGKKGCGALSGRLGKLRGPKITRAVLDRKGGFTLFGAQSIEGRSMVFKDKKGRRVSCGSLDQRSTIVLPGALVPAVQSGNDTVHGFGEGVYHAKIPRTKTTKKASQEAVPKSGVVASAQPFRGRTATPSHSPSRVPGSLDLSAMSQPSVRSFIPNSLSRCPPGMTCPTRKCRTNCDNLQTCCRCMRWLTKDGSCAPDGWIKFQGRGDCNFTTDCPPGIVCLGVKRLQTLTEHGVDETCCECFAHNLDGSCKPEAFKVVRGSGECSFGVDPSLLKSLSSSSGALPQGD